MSYLLVFNSGTVPQPFSRGHLYYRMLLLSLGLADVSLQLASGYTGSVRGHMKSQCPLRAVHLKPWEAIATGIAMSIGMEKCYPVSPVHICCFSPFALNT